MTQEHDGDGDGDGDGDVHGDGDGDGDGHEGGHGDGGIEDVVSAKEFLEHADVVAYIRRIPSWISTEELGRQVLANECQSLPLA